MDTPERTSQMTTPVSKFEDSPIFNYINSLSPIKPARSIHISQAFHPLSFASVPSIFTSPHISAHKESRFVSRTHCADVSKQAFSYESGNEVCGGEGVYKDSADLREDFDAGVSIEEPPREHLKLAVTLPRTLKYGYHSPECDSTPCRGNQSDFLYDLAGTSASTAPLFMEADKQPSSEGVSHIQVIHQIEQGPEAAEYDWESVVLDASDMLSFNSPVDQQTLKGLMLESENTNAGFASYSHMEQMQTVYPICSGEQHEMEDPSTQPGENVDQNQMNQVHDNLVSNQRKHKCMASHITQEVDNEVQTSMDAICKTISNLHRGMRRRCLDFEMVGVCRKNMDEVSSSSSSVFGHSYERIDSPGRSLVPVKTSSDSSGCTLPGIGLHLNALAVSTKENKPIKLESLSSAVSFHSPTMNQEFHDSHALIPSEREMDDGQTVASLAEDASQVSAYLGGEELNQSSPKKKRRRLEGESEGCKRCNCKKSKCLKLYCECFAAGIYCIEPCSCQECFNKPIHEDTVLATRKQIESRNPLAFAPKVIRSYESVPEPGDEFGKTPASARHKRGCNCKKSSCLKKYCECYQGGVGCSINCRCEGCKNAFGKKDVYPGSDPTEVDDEIDHETAASEKSGAHIGTKKTGILSNEEQTPNSVLTTPLQRCRQLAQLPLSSTSIPPISLLGNGSSSLSYTGQKYGKPNIIRRVTKFEKEYQNIPVDDIPEILEGSCGPSVGVKSSSPNSKRVSPPQINLGTLSSGIRSGRKLILQSIPSFPSLTPQL